MFRSLLVTAASLFLASTPAFAGPKEDVQAAAKKLADAPSFSWTQTVESGFGTFSSNGKTQKDGLVWLSQTFGDNTTEMVKQGEKAAIKTQDGWRSVAELAEGDQQGPGRFMVRMVQNFRSPAAQAEEAAGKTKELAKSADAFTGDLTEDGAKDLLSFGGRRGAAAGQAPPEIKNAKGTAKFWTKDGLLSKAEYKVSGTTNFNGEDRDLDRTTTIEIKDVGTTKVEVPAEAKAKLQ